MKTLHEEGTPGRAFHRRLYPDWQVGHSEGEGMLPGKFVPATVPGAVQLDIARAEGYPNHNFSDNYHRFDWMEDAWFTYVTEFEAPPAQSSQRVWFISRGIDYEFSIELNGHPIHRQEGMFTPVELDITPYLQPVNRMYVRLKPAPKRHPSPADRTQASHVVKPAVSYLWDWHPRLIPLGIWDETYIEVRDGNRLEDVHFDYELTGDLSRADIRVKIAGDIRDEALFYSWTLAGEDSAEVTSRKIPAATGACFEFPLDNPQLWWPHDHGRPYLYTSTVELVDATGRVLDRDIKRIGLRRVRLVMNEGGWSEPKGFPKGRSVAPAQIEINGRRIFAKGTNWVNPEIFVGTITGERYRELIDLALSANFNILRAWGGSIVNKESFFELCDRRGIMVWQEFPLACNEYPDDGHYLSILEQEARSIIRRLRNHPCVVMWCGGNELFNNWSGMTDQSLPLRLLNALCYRYDPRTPFNPTSPMYGMAHGHYVFRWEGREVYRMMNESRYTAYTEFGIPGISPRPVLEKIIPPGELFPPRPDTAWESHHAFRAWDGDVNTWLCGDLLADYMGQARDLDELIDQSNLVQCEGYKAIYEEARRQKPYCSMALNWCFNEPWPSAANNSLVVYPAVPKPALGAVGNSCRAVCASARLSKFVWEEGEYFHAELWMLNDSFDEVGSFTVNAYLEAAGRKIPLQHWQTVDLPPNTNVAGPTVRLMLPELDADRIKLVLEVDSHPDLGSDYTLVYRRSRAKRISNSMNVTE